MEVYGACKAIYLMFRSITSLREDILIASSVLSEERAPISACAVPTMEKGEEIERRKKER